jgi:hypothetical protein
MSLSAGKSSTTNKEQLDPVTRDWISRIDQATRGAAGHMPDAPSNELMGANNYFSGATQAGQQGLDALGGDSAAVERLMNPYQDQVIDSLMGDWDRIAQKTQMDVGDRASAAGAFGGSRHGVASGVADAEVDMAARTQIADLRRGGYNDAMGRAGQLAGFGFQGAQAGMGMDAYLREIDRLRNGGFAADTLKQGLMGLPYGKTTTTRGTSYGLVPKEG